MPKNQVHNEVWDIMQRTRTAYPSSGHPFWNNIEREIQTRMFPVLQQYFAASEALSIIFNADVLKAFFEDVNSSDGNPEPIR